MGRRRHVPSQLIDRLWEECDSSVLLNDGNLPRLSKNGTSITGSSFEMALDDGVRCGIGEDGRRLHESSELQMRGMGDKVEDGKATVEISA